MNRPNDYQDNDAPRPLDAAQPSAYPQDTQETTVTQVTPDEVLLTEGPITPSDPDGTPTPQQMEQDVITVNPSVDSMESRG